VNEAEHDWNGKQASEDRKPKAPQWDGAPVPQPSDQTPPWEAQPQSGPPSPWDSSRPNSVPPSPWGTPRPDSSPPASTWDTQPAPTEDTTWPLPVSPSPQQPATTTATTTWGRPEPVPAPSRQAEPPAPGRRNNRLAGWIAGVVVAALAAGLGGYFIGAAGDDGKATEETSTESPTGVSVFETLQMAQNKGKLDRELAVLGEPWLASASLDNCVADVDKGAPPLGGDEARHVTCRFGAAFVHFVVFKAAEQKDAARTYRQQLNFNSDEINPGVQDPSRVAGGASKANGKLIEYAFRQQEGRAMCGVFWEREDDPLGAVMVEALCEENLGGKWEPLRDLWQRHS
jgi:hypothetical protein